MARKNPFEVLELQEQSIRALALGDAQAAIKKAYKALALKHHPDRDKTPEGKQKFIEVTAAFDALIDPSKLSRQQRGEWDTSYASGSTPNASHSSQGTGTDAQWEYSVYDWEEIFRGFGKRAREQSARAQQTRRDWEGRKAKASQRTEDDLPRDARFCTHTDYENEDLQYDWKSIATKQFLDNEFIEVLRKAPPR